MTEPAQHAEKVRARGPDVRRKATAQAVALIAWDWIDWAMEHRAAWVHAGHRDGKCWCKSAEDCVLLDLRAFAYRTAHSDGGVSDD
jgi:hypothetical protein